MRQLGMINICSTLALLMATLAAESAAGGETGLWGDRPVRTMTWPDNSRIETLVCGMAHADDAVIWRAGPAGFSENPATGILAAMYCVTPIDAEFAPRDRHSRHDIQYPARTYPDTQRLTPRAVPKLRPVTMRIVWRSRPARAGTR